MIPTFEEYMRPTFNEYKTYCKNVGKTPGRETTLKEFTKGVNDGSLKKCDCCDGYIDEVHSFRARYDHDKFICENCSNNGN